MKHHNGPVHGQKIVDFALTRLKQRDPRKRARITTGIWGVSRFSCNLSCSTGQIATENNHPQYSPSAAPAVRQELGQHFPIQPLTLARLGSANLLFDIASTIPPAFFDPKSQTNPSKIACRG